MLYILKNFKTKPLQHSTFHINKPTNSSELMVSDYIYSIYTCWVGSGYPMVSYFQFRQILGENYLTLTMYLVSKDVDLAVFLIHSELNQYILKVCFFRCSLSTYILWLKVFGNMPSGIQHY